MLHQGRCEQQAHLKNKGCSRNCLRKGVRVPLIAATRTNVTQPLQLVATTPLWPSQGKQCRKFRRRWWPAQGGNFITAAAAAAVGQHMLQAQTACVAAARLCAG
jgi:hypothetical protein